jgi:hypothetical protein
VALNEVVEPALLQTLLLGRNIADAKASSSLSAPAIRERTRRKKKSFIVACGKNRTSFLIFVSHLSHVVDFPLYFLCALHEMLYHKDIEDALLHHLISLIFYRAIVHDKKFIKTDR